MQKVTSNSEQVALNATPTQVKARFGVYEVSWDSVKQPSGANVITRVANAFAEAVKNIFKEIYNLAVAIPNKIYSLLYPNAANSEEISDDDIAIQHDSSIISFYDSSEEEDEIEAQGDLPEPIVESDENLPEPAAAKSRTWLKTGLIGTGAVVGTGALMIAANRYGVTIPYFGYNIPGAAAIDNAWQATYNATSSMPASAKEQLCNWVGFFCPSKP